MQMLTPEQHLSLLKRAYEDIGPKSPQQVEEHARWHFAYARNTQESERLFVEALRGEPSARHFYQLAAFLVSEEREARPMIEEGLQRHSDFAPLWALLGRCLEKGPDSLNAYHRAVELAPENRCFRHRAACALALAGDYPASLPLLFKLQEMNPTSRMSYNLGIVLLHLGDQEAARRVLSTVIPDPFGPEEDSIAEALVCAGDPKAALAFDDTFGLCPLQWCGMAIALAEHDPIRFQIWVGHCIQRTRKTLDKCKLEVEQDPEWLSSLQTELADLRRLLVDTSGLEIKLPSVIEPWGCPLFDCPLHPPNQDWNES